MISSPSLFFGVWTPAVGCWLYLTYRYYDSWDARTEDLGDQIRDFNAQQGYDLSVGRNELARDLQRPFGESKLRTFAEQNNVPYSVYRRELRENIGSQTRFLWILVIDFFGLIYTLAGISYMAPWRILPADIYLSSVYALLLMSALLYSRV